MTVPQNNPVCTMVYRTFEIIFRAIVECSVVPFQTSPRFREGFSVVVVVVSVVPRRRMEPRGGSAGSERERVGSERWDHRRHLLGSINDLTFTKWRVATAAPDAGYEPPPELFGRLRHGVFLPSTRTDPASPLSAPTPPRPPPRRHPPSYTLGSREII